MQIYIKKYPYINRNMKITTLKEVSKILSSILLSSSYKIEEKWYFDL